MEIKVGNVFPTYLHDKEHRTEPSNLFFIHLFFGTEDQSYNVVLARHALRLLS